MAHKSSMVSKRVEPTHSLTALLETTGTQRYLCEPNSGPGTTHLELLYPTRRRRSQVPLWMTKLCNGCKKWNFTLPVKLQRALLPFTKRCRSALSITAMGNGTCSSVKIRMLKNGNRTLGVSIPRTLKPLPLPALTKWKHSAAGMVSFTS